MEAPDGASDGDRADHRHRTLQCEIFFNADESEAIVFERYRDSDAALEHFADFGHLMAALMEPPPSPASCSATPTTRSVRT